MTDPITHRFVAELSLTGIGFDVLGGCYLAHDLLCGKRGPLRTIATVLIFAFLRGFVLGLAGISVAGPSFGVVFGILSGIGLSISYALGFAPTHDYETKSKPHLSRHKVLASLWLATVVSVAGMTAGLLTAAETHYDIVIANPL